MEPEQNKACFDYLGRAVIISAARASRPREFQESRPRKVIPPEKCYFCPGNEHMTPPETDRIKIGKNWLARSFPNKFPATSPAWKEAHGSHEVIVETPDHQKRFSEISEDQMKHFLILLRRRIQALYKDKKIKYVSVFKNEGLRAGASIEHSHTQIISISYIPKEILEISKAQRQKEAYIKKAKRLFSNSLFQAVIPPCPRFHYETWIIPKKKIQGMEKMSDKELFSFGQILLKSLQSLDPSLNYPSYNIAFMTPPPGKEFSKMTMHAEILPRLSTWAGFELSGAGWLNSVSPTAAYELLKSNGQK